MGCSVSSLAVAELNKSLQAGDGGRALMGKLEDSPWLLSTATSVLVSTAGTPLHVACENKHVEAVQKMLSFLSCSPLATVREALQPYCRRAGVPLPSSVAGGIKIAVDMVNCKGQTPLMYSCSVGSPELVKLLLVQGADPWARDRCGCRTALHYASMCGSAACIEALMAHLTGRDMEQQGVRYVNARSLCGLTALHYAVFFEHTAAVEQLLRHDPAINAATTCDSYDVHVTCDPFSTPLHFAAVRGNTQLALLLLQHYATHGPSWDLPRNQDPRMRCNYGNQMPWQVAASHHPSARELVSLLHPRQALEVVLGFASDGRGGWLNRVGPQSLAALAAAALRHKLLVDLAALRPPQPAAEAGLQAGERAAAVTQALLPGEVASVSSGCQPTSLSCTQPQEAPKRSDSNDDEGLCGVCFAAPEEVKPAGCSHGLCGTCAEALARGLVGNCRPRPLACPFCRREVGAFVARPGTPMPPMAVVGRPQGSGRTLPPMRAAGSA